MEYQKVLRITRTRDVKREQIPIEGEVLIQKKLMLGWKIMRDFIGPIKGVKNVFGLSDKASYMIIDDKDGLAVSPYRPTGEALKAICTTKGDEEMADRQGDYQDTKDKSNEKSAWYYNSMALAIMGIVVVTLIVILLAVTGKIKFGMPQ